MIDGSDIREGDEVLIRAQVTGAPFEGAGGHWIYARVDGAVRLIALDNVAAHHQRFEIGQALWHRTDGKCRAVTLLSLHGDLAWVVGVDERPATVKLANLLWPKLSALAGASEALAGGPPRTGAAVASAAASFLKGSASHSPHPGPPPLAGEGADSVGGVS